MSTKTKAPPKKVYHRALGVNLKVLSGGRYRIQKDPGWINVRSCKTREQREAAENDNEWLYIIPCKRGGKISGLKANIYSHSNTELGFIGAGVGLRRELLKLDGVRSHQVGDKEFSVVFPNALLDAVSGVVGARPKRKVRVTSNTPLLER